MFWKKHNNKKFDSIIEMFESAEHDQLLAARYNAGILTGEPLEEFNKRFLEEYGFPVPDDAGEYLGPYNTEKGVMSDYDMGWLESFTQARQDTEIAKTAKRTRWPLFMTEDDLLFFILRIERIKWMLRVATEENEYNLGGFSAIDNWVQEIEVHNPELVKKHLK